MKGDAVHRSRPRTAASSFAFAVAFASLAVTAIEADAQSLHGVATLEPTGRGGPEAVVTLDLLTGAGTRISPSISFDVEYIGADYFCGELYLFSSWAPDVRSGDLFRVDLATGQEELVQSFTVRAADPDFKKGIGFEFASDGAPLVLAGGDLYRLNLETSEAEFVGSTGYDEHKNLVLAADCEVYTIGRDPFLPAGPHIFMRLDPLTAAPTVLGSLGVPKINALEVTPAGELYATDPDGNLLELDPATGALLRTVGATGFTTVPALAFVAAPACDGAPVELVLGHRSPTADDARFEWLPAARGGYDVCFVRDKRDLAGTCAVTGTPVAACTPTVTTDCVDQDAVPGPSGEVLFYQVKGLCAAVEGH